MKMQSINEQFDLFLNSSNKNQWISTNIMKVYVRKSKRFIDGEIRTCIDIANIEVESKYQRTGMFKHFIKHVFNTVSKDLYYCVFIENILNINLINWAIINQWILHQDQYSYYKHI